ncbi:hypothetical protein [Streptomyces buecherae]|uniref:hypothetical protein n=1 Tax=Streptomyces buecherae TaxID=2763006 RepID=UPI0037959C91
MRSRQAISVLGAATALAMGLALPATAGAESTNGRTGPSISTVTPSDTTTSDTTDARKACKGVKFTVYGYTGCFRKGSHVGIHNGWQEAFGVAPSGSIWHTWPGAGKWRPMPKGKARDILGAGTKGGKRYVKIQAKVHNYCSWGTGKHKWGTWKRC